jgi:hypothetical protein
MPERDSIQPTMDTNGALDPAAGRSDSPEQGDSDLLGSTGAEARADPERPAAEPATSPEQRPAQMPTEQVGRYHVLGEIGRGGMGTVLRSRDPELGRDLALKLMLGDCADRPEAVQRFREEAQVGGQLQHPGVVPVYELGNADDGRPYFTMKLVKGETLAKLLKERASPTQDRPRFLKIFEQVCQAVAYAHAKGVIHRDLKPGNIMVGAFGEVQVMDWGLAKVLNASVTAGPEPSTQHDPAATVASLVQVARGDSGGSETQEGDVLGTPAYMPPEQALGEISRLDQRADVFSLGALLCEILTGKPPDVGADRVAVQRQARRAELGDGLRRLDACDVDGELIGLTKRCLSAEPGGRPRDAGEVARAIEAYLAGVEERARQAELERAAAEARAEEAKETAQVEQARAREAEAREAAERKQAEEAQARAEAERQRANEAERRTAAERRARRLVLGLAASGLLLVVAGGSGTWLWQTHRLERAHQQAQTDQQTRLTMTSTRTFLAEGWEHNDDAKLAAALADADKAVQVAESGGASEDIRQEADTLRQQAQEKMERAKKNTALLAALLNVTAPRETKQYERSDSGTVLALVEPSVEEQFTQAFRRWAPDLDLDRTPLETLASRIEDQPKRVVQEIVAGLDAGSTRRQATCGLVAAPLAAGRAAGPGQRQPGVAAFAGQRRVGA